MAASQDSVTTALRPPRFAWSLAGARTSRLILKLGRVIRDSVVGARQAIDRMKKLIDNARIDYPDQ